VSLIIAIDGPAASGKGTLARRLAAHFHLPHLDTGLLYRATGQRVLAAGGDPADPAAATLAAQLLVPADWQREDLRGPAADEAAAAVAAIAPVRAALLDFQRRFATAAGAVLDGRDIGTVVFPNAQAKLFVTASVTARGERRWRELRARGIAVDLEEVIAQIRVRDEQDRTRPTSPLVQAADALVLDTTTLDADAAFAQALALLRERRNLTAGPASAGVSA